MDFPLRRPLIGAIVVASPLLPKPDVPTANAPAPQPTKETFMKWETPTACDFRFGFEITMYIAAR